MTAYEGNVELESDASTDELIDQLDEMKDEFVMTRDSDPLSVRVEARPS